MAREYKRWTDDIATVTVLLTAPDTLADETWRGWIPFNTLFLDHRPDQRSLVGVVYDVTFGGENGPPAGVQVVLLAANHGQDWDSNFDPRQHVRSGVALEVTFKSDFAGMTEVPLVLYVSGVAADAPALEDIELPDPTTNSTDIDVLDIQGGAVPSFWEEIEFGGGDADTLEGHPASYFAVAGEGGGGGASLLFDPLVANASNVGTTLTTLDTHEVAADTLNADNMMLKAEWLLKVDNPLGNDITVSLKFGGQAIGAKIVAAIVDAYPISLRIVRTGSATATAIWWTHLPDVFRVKTALTGIDWTDDNALELKAQSPDGGSDEITLEFGYVTLLGAPT